MPLKPAPLPSTANIELGHDQTWRVIRQTWRVIRQTWRVVRQPWRVVRQTWRIIAFATGVPGRRGRPLPRAPAQPLTHIFLPQMPMLFPALKGRTLSSLVL